MLVSALNLKGRRPVILAVVALLVGPTWQASAEHEAYEKVQPRIEDLAAQPVEQLVDQAQARHWKQVYAASVEFSAMLVGLYAGRALYFKMRNVEPAYYVTRMARAGEDAIQRIRRINLSHSGTLTDGKLAEYLASKGLSSERILAGPKTLFVDGTAFEGSTFEAIRRGLSKEAASRIKTQVIGSRLPTVPSCRVAALHLHPSDATTADKDPVLDAEDSLHAVVAGKWEFGYVPQFTGNSDHYALQDGRLMAMSRIDRVVPSADQRKDVQLSKKEAVLFLRGLKAYFATPEVQQHFKQRRKLWRKTHRLIKAQRFGEVDRLIAKQRQRDARFGEAFSRDVKGALGANFRHRHPDNQ